MSRRLLTVALIAATVSLSACKKPEPPAPPAAPVAPAAPATAAAMAAPAEPKAAAALAITNVDLGKDIGADNRITTALDSFDARDTIIASIGYNNTGTAPIDGSIGVRWTDPDGKVFNDESQAKPWPAGAQAVSFRVADPRGFKPGHYKLDVILNGSTMQTKDFTVK